MCKIDINSTSLRISISEQKERGELSWLDPVQMVQLISTASDIIFNIETAHRLLSECGEGFLPILVIGNESCGKTSLLRALARERPLEVPDCLEKGVAVYPYPVKCENTGVPLLLLETSGMSLTPKDIDQQRKIFASLFPIVSLCIICCENSEMIAFLKEVLNVNSRLETGSKLQKILMCIRSMDDIENLRVLEEIKKNELYGPLERGGEGISEDGLNKLLEVIGQLKPYSCASIESPINHWISTAERYSKAAYSKSFEEMIFSISASSPQLLFSIQSEYLSSGRLDSLTLKKETLRLLESRFKDCPKLTPVIVVGHTQCGKSLLVEALLKSHSTPFQSLDSQEGVFVWPCPVPLQDTNLLLMEMTGLNVEEEDPVRKAEVNKLIAVMAALSSHMILCFEKTSLFVNLKNILSIQQTVKEQLRHASSCLLMVESNEMLNKGRLADELETVKKSYGSNAFVVQARGPDGVKLSCVESIEEVLAQSDQLLTISTDEGRNQIQQFAKFAETCEAIANSKGSYRRFAEEFHDCFEEFNNDEDSIRKLIANRKRIAECKGSRLFIKTSDSVKVDSDTFECLKKEFKLDVPTVVLTVIADQGLGKSTLLNHIVRFLDELPFTPEVFKTGNTSTQTTVMSEVFRFLLHLGENQCMLIDLQGLEGLETMDERNQIEQSRLILCVLALVSVPLIVIRNERNSLTFLEKKIHQIHEMMEYYHFSIERIVLLFHDKDENAEANEIWTVKISEFEERFFDGRRVIIVLNKPNFVRESSKSNEIQNAFLMRLLKKCLFPKKYNSGEPVRLLEVIETIESIVQGLEDVRKLHLGKDEIVICDQVRSYWKNQADELFEQIKCQKGSLSALAKEMVNNAQETFLPMLKMYSVKVQRKCETDATNISNRMLKDIRIIESWYFGIEFMNDDDVLAAFNKYIEEALKVSRVFRIAISKPTYKNILERLRRIVRALNDHYPTRIIFDAIENIIINKKASCKNGSYGFSLFNSPQPEYIDSIMREYTVKLTGRVEECWQNKPASSLNLEVLKSTDAIFILVVRDNTGQSKTFANKLVEAISFFTLPDFTTFSEKEEIEMLSFDVAVEPYLKQRGYVLSVELLMNSLSMIGALFALAFDVYIFNSQPSSESNAKLAALISSHQQFRIEDMNQNVTIFEPMQPEKEIIRSNLENFVHNAKIVADPIHLHEKLLEVTAKIRNARAVSLSTINQVLKQARGY